MAHCSQGAQAPGGWFDGGSGCLAPTHAPAQRNSRDAGASTGGGRGALREKPRELITAGGCLLISPAWAFMTNSFKCITYSLSTGARLGGGPGSWDIKEGALMEVPCGTSRQRTARVRMHAQVHRGQLGTSLRKVRGF